MSATKVFPPWKKKKQPPKNKRINIFCVSKYNVVITMMNLSLVLFFLSLFFFYSFSSYSLVIPNLSLGYICAPWLRGNPLPLNPCSTYCLSPEEKSVTKNKSVFFISSFITWNSI
uniref:Uncharacterized protein n=1 Tax=Sphaerodactylus townsendi TaxID=933632 RepID=A0ACB8FB96_9SAUR